MAKQTYPVRLRHDWPAESWERDRPSGEGSIVLKRPTHPLDAETVVNLSASDLEVVRHDVAKGTVELVELNKRGDKARPLNRPGQKPGAHLPPKPVVVTDDDFEGPLDPGVAKAAEAEAAKPAATAKK